MLGKGAKRKLDEDEEGLEGKAMAALSGAASTGGGGPEGPGGGVTKGVSYTLQRQTIFNISLLKLYSQRALSEPSLQRRVLINNMLRRIQDELKQEGALRPLPFPAPSPMPATPHDHHLLDEGFRQASSSPTPSTTASFGVLSATGLGSAAATATQGSPANGLTLQPPPQACLTPASLLEEDAGSFAALPPPPAPSLVPPSSTSSPSSFSSPLLLGAPCRPLRDSFSSALDEIEELCPSAAVAMTAIHATTSPSPSPLSICSMSLPPTSPSASSLHLTLSPPALVPSLALSVSDSKDCGKADSSKLDVVPMDVLPPAELDMSTSPSSCTSSSSSSSTPSSSCTATSSSSSSGFLTDLALDDILFADIDTSMYDFDPCTTASGAGSGASKLTPVVTADDLLKTLSSPGVTPNQPFKMDLTELDHIMEVLVGS